MKNNFAVEARIISWAELWAPTPCSGTRYIMKEFRIRYNSFFNFWDEMASNFEVTEAREDR